MPKKNERELFDLCNRYWYDCEEEDSEAMVNGVKNILGWINHHKNDAAHLKAALLYTDKYGSTGLHCVVSVNDAPFEVVEAWLKHAPETAQIKGEYGWLPLHYACDHRSSLKVVMALFEAYPKSVEEEADAEWMGNPPILPLHCAACGQMEPPLPLSVEVLSFLLKAYPKSVNGKNNEDTASYYLQRWARLTSGFGIEFDSDGEEVPYDSSEVDNKLITSFMHKAVIGGNYLVVKLFVIAFPGISIMPDKDGMVSLHYAFTNIASIDVAMVLLDAAPESATILDKWGRTPLQLSMPFAKLKDENGMLPLHFQAAHSKSLTVNFLKFLIAAYPDSIDVPDNRGMLPFHYAFINKSLSVDILMYFVEMNLQRL